MIEVDPFIDPYDKTRDLDKSILIKLDTTILVVTGHLGFGLKRQNIFSFFFVWESRQFIIYLFCLLDMALVIEFLFRLSHSPLLASC